MSAESNYETDQLCSPMVPGTFEKNKVFVSNLRPHVTSRMLKTFFSEIVPVTHAVVIINRDTLKSRGFGFVTVQNIDDVNKLLNLRYEDRYLQGRPIVIKKARKKITTQEFKVFMSSRRFDRDYDLSVPDPKLPTMHCLVDDTLSHIFSFLKDEELIRIERVCRRWQNLVYDRFSKVKSLNMQKVKEKLARERGGFPHYGAFIKYVILTGENLEEIVLDHLVSSPSEPFLLTVGALCRRLHTLDVSFSTFSERCVRNLMPALVSLKKFIAKGCSVPIDRPIDLLLQHSTKLEYLDVMFTNLNGWCLKRLPKTLKELHLGYRGLRLSNAVELIKKNCPDIVTLELLISSKHDSKPMTDLGNACLNITSLSLHFDSEVNHDFIHAFPKLQYLNISSKLHAQNIDYMLPHLSKLEHLDMDIAEYKGEVDLSDLKSIKKIALNIQTLLNYQLDTLTECKTLESVELRGKSTNLQYVCSLLRSCPHLVNLDCKNIIYDVSMYKTLQDATANLKRFIEFRFGSLDLRSECALSPVEDIVGENFRIKLESPPFLFHWDDSDYTDEDSIYSDFDNMDDGLFFLGLDDPDDWFDDFSLLMRMNNDDYYYGQDDDLFDLY